MARNTNGFLGSNFENFINGLAGEGQQELTAEQIREARRQQIEDAKIYFEVFGQGRGLQLLDILKDRTTRASVMQVTGCIIDGDINLSPGEFMAGREMQNALIRHIEKQIILAQQPLDQE